MWQSFRTQQRSDRPTIFAGTLGLVLLLAMPATAEVSNDIPVGSGKVAAPAINPDVVWGDDQGSRTCATFLSLGHWVDDALYTTRHKILFAQPRETLSLTFNFQVAWQSASNAKAPPLDFRWDMSSASGKTAPATGESVLYEAGTDAFDGNEYATRRGLIQSRHIAADREGQYSLSVSALLDKESAAQAKIPPSCWKRRGDWTVVVGGAAYGVSVTGQYLTKDGARAGLKVSGSFDIDAKNRVHGQATHENWILGECVQYRDSMPQTIDGWIEGDRIHLRFNKAGEATTSTDNVNTDDMSCMFKGIKELGVLLALVGSDVAKQVGDPRTGTAALPGGLQIPGEVTFPVLKPGQESMQAIGNLRYSMRRRN